MRQKKTSNVFYQYLIFPGICGHFYAFWFDKITTDQGMLRNRTEKETLWTHKKNKTRCKIYQLVATIYFILENVEDNFVAVLQFSKLTTPLP